jgi:hypothetical protein
MELFAVVRRGMELFLHRNAQHFVETYCLHLQDQLIDHVTSLDQ